MQHTLTVRPSAEKLDALIAFLKALHIPFEEAADTAGVITDPELIRRIESYEKGTATLKTVSLAEIQKRSDV